MTPLAPLTDHYTPEARAQAEAELFGLLRIPSVSADPAHAGDMGRAAEFLRSKLAALGFEARTDETAGHPVVYAEHLKALAAALRNGGSASACCPSNASSVQPQLQPSGLYRCANKVDDDPSCATTPA